MQQIWVRAIKRSIRNRTFSDNYIQVYLRNCILKGYTAQAYIIEKQSEKRNCTLLSNYLTTDAAASSPAIRYIIWCHIIYRSQTPCSGIFQLAYDSIYFEMLPMQACVAILHAICELHVYMQITRHDCVLGDTLIPRDSEIALHDCVFGNNLIPRDS